MNIKTHRRGKMPDFWKWVESRQDARQWSEDEKACAELAWLAAIESYDKHIQDFVNRVALGIDKQIGDKIVP